MTKPQQHLARESNGWPRDPLKYYVEFPLRAIHYPFGLPLEITTNSPIVIAAAQESWGAFPKFRSVVPVHLRIGVSQAGREELPPTPIFRAQRSLVTIIADSENFGVCDVNEGFGFGWVTPFTAADSAFLRHHFLDVMTWLLLAPVHFAIVHAACIALDGHGILLCGHSGAGKSSLAFACAQRGWTFVSDDASYVPRKSTGRLVIGNPLRLRFREDAGDLFPELRERTVVRRQNGELGFEILPGNLPAFSTAFSCEIDHIVFLNRRATGEVKLCAFPKEEAQRRLDDVLEFTLACKLSSGSTEGKPELTLANPEAREEQRAAVRELLTADVHELSYFSLDSAVECLETLVRRGV